MQLNINTNQIRTQASWYDQIETEANRPSVTGSYSCIVVESVLPRSQLLFSSNSWACKQQTASPRSLQGVSGASFDYPKYN